MLQVVLFIISYVLIGHPLANAAEETLCAPSLYSGCAESQDMSPSCLQKLYACGQYDTIVGVLFAEQMAPTPTQKYYLGASFFGKHSRVRALSLRCEWLWQAKAQLKDFLYDAKDIYNRVGDFDVIEHTHIFHATKLLNHANSVKGCPESGFTASDLQRLAKSSGRARISAMFLGGPESSDPLQIAVAADMNQLMSQLRQVIANASSIETNLGIKDVEIKAGFRHIGTLMDLLAEVYGRENLRISGDSIIIKRDRLLALRNQILDPMTGLKKAYNDVEKVAKDAILGIEPRAYEQAKLRTVEEADLLSQLLLTHVNFESSLFPASTQKAFWQLKAAAEQPSGRLELMIQAKELHQKWYKHGEEWGYCPGEAWFCRELPQRN